MGTDRADQESGKDSLPDSALWLAWAILGMALTFLVSLLVLNLGNRVQILVYDFYYLDSGPASAMRTAILVHFLAAAMIGLSTVLVVGDLVSDKGAHLRTLGVAIIGFSGVLAIFLGIAAVGLASFLTAIALVALSLIAIPVTLHYYFGVDSAAVPAFLGGIPVVVVVLVLAGFGLGWGWGYVMTATEVPHSTVKGPVADFDTIPEVREDLLVDGDCAVQDGLRKCRLQLRGYEHAVPAVRFMDRHGVRCPAQSSSEGSSDKFYAEYAGTLYEVTCSPHGD